MVNWIFYFLFFFSFIFTHISVTPIVVVDIKIIVDVIGNTEDIDFNSNDSIENKEWME